MEEKNTPRRPRRNTDEQPKAVKNESLVYGKNPVTELLKSGSGVDTVLLAEGMAPAVAAYYTAMAKEVGAAVKRVNPNKLRLMTGTDSHQGVAAFASEIEYVTVEDLLEAAKAKGEPPFLVLSDGIEDPHNLGAVMRSALLCGAHGIVIPKRGGASVTPTVIKSSAGAAERLPVARVANIGETIRRLKEQGVFVYCADMDGVPLRKNNLTPFWIYSFLVYTLNTIMLTYSCHKCIIMSPVKRNCGMKCLIMCSIKAALYYVSICHLVKQSILNQISV